MTVAMSGHLERRHLDQVPRDRLALAALLGAQAGPGAWRVDEGEHRHLELLGQLHQAERLAIALGVRHAEVAPQVLARVAAALVADHHHRLALQPRPAGHDRGVLAEQPIAVQLDEVGEDQLDVVERERTPRAARHLHALQRREVAIDLRAQLAQLPLQRRDHLAEVDLAVTRHALQVVDLLLQLDDRLLEFQRCRARHVSSRAPVGPARRRAAPEVP